uniref:Resolvase/invertase-type recombinase catalytic domain-containing protein n=1 Tax=viral metagenome TaxID=1070528 RepID=A0A6C0EC48_9ZZZZ
MEYVKRKDALKTLGICYKTLYKMAENKEIDTVTVGSNQLYNINKYLREHKITKVGREKICYCRVSSKKQKEDLERQIEFMKKKYPNHTIIKDIGSGLNNKRSGLLEIMEKAIKGEIEELVVAYKDRLSRFGFEMIEWLIEKYSNGKIIVINKAEEKTPTEEITKDIISIMNVYVAKINGLRKYKKEIKTTIDEHDEKD